MPACALRAHILAFAFLTQALAAPTAVSLDADFQLADSAGAPLPQTRAALIPVSVAAGQEPGTLRLSVTGEAK